ncbi:MAG: lipoprotein signal peptidase [Rikenellaceae bacterium]|nr:lipoprotein signal peptidase [Rikenellaceae bacterium]
MNNKKTITTVTLLIVLLLIIDQVTKLLVKCNMSLGESIYIFDWFQIHFIENPGAAFGMTLGGVWGKIVLTVFRIVASGAIGWYIWRLIKQGAPKGIIFSLAVILAGALGNLIDSVFYGVIFDYAPLLQGKVVDMLYFPLFTIQNMPSWLDWMCSADGSWTFFSPVFNIADSYITCAVIYIILFERKFFG